MWLGVSKFLSLSFKLIPCVRQSPEGRLDDKEFECMKLEDRLDFFGDGANIFGLFREFIYLYFADSGAIGAFGLRPSVPMDILLFLGLLL